MSAPFRLLSLGCCDAGIERWLANELQGRELHIDGVDLDRRQIALARERMADVPGEWKLGSALDAASLFEPGSYDAIAAYELIEHVPDMGVFLDGVEAMLKPRGRVYISTPDGTFGAGYNPHHLRALRAVDLADLLRRRGRLHDIGVGSDGVTVGVYTPGPRKEDVAIYLGSCWNAWHPSDIETKGLGGSETAAIRLAEALNDLGFVVTVYGEVSQQHVGTSAISGEPTGHDVIYRDWRVFDPLERRGAVICSRIPEIGDRPINAPTRLLWTHDTDFGPRLTPARLEAFDGVLCLSKWHERHLRGCYPFAKDKLIRTRNGIRHDYFDPKPWKDRAQRVVYCSSPDRGLDVLLELWPQVRKAAPKAELHYCYPDVYDAVADQDATVAAHRDRIAELADQPGVTRLGALSQPSLAALLCDSRVWAHPSWMTLAGAPFHETYAIACIEAQAAGCFCVCSDWGALSENVRWGVKCNSDPPGRKWRSALVAGIVQGLTDEESGRVAVYQGPKRVKALGWDGVGEQVGKLIASRDTGTARAG
jgi:glycosyltransferase involved in cell wall biosynthesis